MKRSTAVAIAAAVLAAAGLLVLLLDDPAPGAAAAQTYRTHPTPGGDGDCTLVDATDAVDTAPATDAVENGAPLPGEVSRLGEDACRTVDRLEPSTIAADALGDQTATVLTGS